MRQRKGKSGNINTEAQKAEKIEIAAIIQQENTIIKYKRENGGTTYMKEKIQEKVKGIVRAGLKQEPGIDGILVTIGLCVIALLLCVVMKDSLKVFIETIVASMTTEAQNILSGVTP